MQHTATKGYIAIISVLIIASVVLIIGLSITLTSITEAQISLSHSKSDQALSALEGCVEEFLLYINENNYLTFTTLSIPEASCNISNVSLVGQVWSFDITTTTVDNYKKTEHIEINRSTVVGITSWQEK